MWVLLHDQTPPDGPYEADGGEYVHEFVWNELGQMVGEGQKGNLGGSGNCDEADGEPPPRIFPVIYQLHFLCFLSQL